MKTKETTVEVMKLKNGAVVYVWDDAYQYYEPGAFSTPCKKCGATAKIGAGWERPCSWGQHDTGESFTSGLTFIEAIAQAEALP